MATDVETVAEMRAIEVAVVELALMWWMCVSPESPYSGNDPERLQRFRERAEEDLLYGVTDLYRRREAAKRAAE